MIASHLGKALEHLHDRNLIHGDFKPLNACRVPGQRASEISVGIHVVSETQMPCSIAGISVELPQSCHNFVCMCALSSYEARRNLVDVFFVLKKRITISVFRIFVLVA